MTSYLQKQQKLHPSKIHTYTVYVHIIHVNIIRTYIHVYVYCYFILQVNTFQCVLVTTVTDSFVILLYADGEIQWTTGDASGGVDGLGGTEAVVGINVGDGINSITIPGSMTPSIINIAQTSNVGIPGMWIFQVGSGKLLHAFVCSYICMLVNKIHITFLAQ